MADYRGRVVVLTFGYTHCPDVCPVTLADLAAVMQQLGPDAPRVQVIFITLDPERDGAELIGRYVAAFHPSFVGLRGDAKATEEAARRFGVFYRRQPGAAPDTYAIDHSTGSLLFDTAGRPAGTLAYATPPAEMAQAIRRLLR